jgi:hypothetical protein
MTASRGPVNPRPPWCAVPLKHRARRGVGVGPVLKARADAGPPLRLPRSGRPCDAALLASGNRPRQVPVSLADGSLLSQPPQRHEPLQPQVGAGAGMSRTCWLRWSAGRQRRRGRRPVASARPCCRSSPTALHMAVRQRRLADRVADRAARSGRRVRRSHLADARAVSSRRTCWSGSARAPARPVTLAAAAAGAPDPRPSRRPGARRSRSRSPVRRFVRPAPDRGATRPVGAEPTPAAGYPQRSRTPAPR